jgi:hypothetical protein
MPSDNFKVPGTQQVKKPASQPPAVSEAIGSTIPEESVFDKEQNSDQAQLNETRRLDRIGVKSDDIGQVRRGVNIVAEGQHGDITGKVVLEPRPIPSQDEFPGTYKVNNYGDAMPAKSLGSVVATPAPKSGAPAPQEQSAVEFKPQPEQK